MILRKTLVKYRYELEIKPYIERHVFKYEENLPKEFYTDVTYGNSIKVFGKKSKDTITNLENNFLNKIIEYTDETRTKFDKEKLYVRN